MATSNYPIHECVEYPPDGAPVATPCACRYPTSHPWPPHGGEAGRRLVKSVDCDCAPSAHTMGDPPVEPTIPTHITLYFGALKEEMRLAEVRIADLESDVARLRAVLDDIYPTLATRAMVLQQAGEERAAAHWSEICQKVASTWPAPRRAVGRMGLSGNLRVTKDHEA